MKIEITLTIEDGENRKFYVTSEENLEAVLRDGIAVLAPDTISNTAQQLTNRALKQFFDNCWG